MTAADLANVITLLQLVLALQAAMLPAMFWFVRFLWKLERRVYTIELALGIAERSP